MKDSLLKPLFGDRDVIIEVTRVKKELRNGRVDIRSLVDPSMHSGPLPASNHNCSPNIITAAAEDSVCVDSLSVFI